MKSKGMKGNGYPHGESGPVCNKPGTNQGRKAMQPPTSNTKSVGKGEIQHTPTHLFGSPKGGRNRYGSYRGK